MVAKRQSGILLHPTSLPGPHGSGDLGESARHFVDWLAAGKQTLWQVLPLGGVGPGYSPYMSPSAFAGNELLIDLAQLHRAGWLSADDIVPDPSLREDRIDYPTVKHFRMSRLRLAARSFFNEGHVRSHGDYKEFCDRAKTWLDDYALFMALDHRHGWQGAVWQDWPAAIAQRDQATIAAHCGDPVCV